MEVWKWRRKIVFSANTRLSIQDTRSVSTYRNWRTWRLINVPRRRDAIYLHQTSRQVHGRFISSSRTAEPTTSSPATNSIKPVASHFFTNNKQNRLSGLRPRAVADAATAYFNGTNHLNYRAKSIHSIDAIWVRFSQFLVVAGTVSIDWRRVEIGKTDLRAGRLDSAFSQLLVWRRRCRTAISSWVLL